MIVSPSLATTVAVTAWGRLLGCPRATRAALDAVRAFEREGRIGRVHDAFYTTTGNGTPVASSTRFGGEIASELRDAGVQAVLLSGT